MRPLSSRRRPREECFGKGCQLHTSTTKTPTTRNNGCNCKVALFDLLGACVAIYDDWGRNYLQQTLLPGIEPRLITHSFTLHYFTLLYLLHCTLLYFDFYFTLTLLFFTLLYFTSLYLLTCYRCLARRLPITTTSSTANDLLCYFETMNKSKSLNKCTWHAEDSLHMPRGGLSLTEVGCRCSECCYEL